MVLHMPQKGAVAMDRQGQARGRHGPLPGLERHHNPFLGLAAGPRTLSALQLPFFALRPPPGFGVLTTTGRKTGKTRRKCVRAILCGDKAFLVAIGGERNAWLMNIRANSNVRLRVQGGTFAGVARDPHEGPEAQQAMERYCGTVNRFDYLACAIWRKGRPTRSKINELNRAWFDHGTPLVIELAGR